MLKIIKKFPISSVTLVTYHYVRDENKNNLLNSLNYLHINNFKEQIMFFKKNASIIDNSQFLDILLSKRMPKKPCIMLTFDDGYKDHFKNITPILIDNKIKGLFYLTTDIFNNKILEVNKIQLIVNYKKNPKKLINEINLLLKKYQHPLINEKTIENLNLKKFKWDDHYTKICKFFLQYQIKDYCRSEIVNILFKKILNITKKKFIESMYLNLKDIHSMFKSGMTFGIHGKTHNHLNKISLQDVDKEIKGTIDFFNKYKINNNNLSCSYPYGSYNRYVIEILKKNKISYAVTTNQDFLTKKNIDKVFEIPRFPCNFFIH